jgi:WD40 repeat protein
MQIRFQKNFNAGIAIVEAMYNSNILALVGGGKKPFHPPNQCIVWDDKEAEIASCLEYKEWVRGVKMTKDVLVVATDNLIRVYDINKQFQMLHKVKTCLNYGGIHELSISPEKPLLLAPLEETGKVALINYSGELEKKELGNVQCCKHAIKSIRLNRDATKFAITSERGTLVRVFDVDTKNQTLELRRGTEQAEIQSVYFSNDSKFLLVASDKGTIHVYSLCDEYSNKKSSLNLISGVLPSFFKSTWSMNKISVPHEKYVAGIVKRANTTDDLYDISVFMYDGKFHHYVFNPVENTIELQEEKQFMTLAE